MWLATFKLALRNLFLHKLRSFLTVLGTILGVASVIAMLSVGEGSKQAAVEQIRQLGAKNVMVRSVRPGSGKEQSSSSTQNQNSSRILEYGLKYEDHRLLDGALPRNIVSHVVPIMLLRKNAQHERFRIANARVLGTIPELVQVKNLKLDRGRFINESDIRDLTNVMVVSEGAAKKLFGFQDPMNQAVLLEDKAFRVVGVLKQQASGNATAGQVGTEDLNDDLYIPLSSARSRLGDRQRIVTAGSRSYERNEISELAISAMSEDYVPQIAEMIRKLLETRKRSAQEYEVVVPLELLQQAEHEKRIWNMVLGSIAGISLLVGGIGIMNIMLATVTERTREIGIRRAIGAKRFDIIRQFLIETIVLSTTGGLIGIFLGVFIPWAVTHFAGIPTSTSLWSVVIAFAISVLTGIVFGVYPARKAAMMNPIEALRHQ
ncbi:MAG: ABC transporter permease [Planctomycetales bacterium]|nr:ABC transporter permease [Planctomycetales bacterium]